MEKNIKKIEDMSLNAWPSHKMELYDGWILRFSYFYTHRTNSVEQFGNSTPAGTSAPSSSTMSMPSFSLPTMNNGSYTGKVPTSTVQKKDIQIPDFLRNR